MRLTTVILIASLIQVSAATFAQRITLNQKGAPLKSVLKEIRKQSGYDFYYDGKIVPEDKKINISVVDASLDEALKATFKGLELSYEIDGRTVSITKKTSSFLDQLTNAFAAIDVHGRVVDEMARPVPGATVKLKDGSVSTITDIKGEFILKTNKEGGIVIITFIGYESKELTAVLDMGEIQLKVATSKLDEVQVQAYGQTSQRLTTGNITTVKASDIEKQPVQNVLLALEGRVPGIFIQQSTGFSRSGVNVKIQGQNTIQSGYDPLYVIDGMPYTSELLPGLSNILGASGNNSGYFAGVGNPLSFINPMDIESISILKDAEATSIYGSRAANGAILIITKKGRPGPAKLDLNVQEGYGQVNRKLKLLNTEQYLGMRKEAYANDGIDYKTLPISFSTADLTLWNQSQYTDWQKALIGGTAKYTNAQASLSGGTMNTSYLFSGNYNRQTTVFPGDLTDQSGSLHINLNSASTDQKFRLAFSANYLVDNNVILSSDLTKAAMTLAPNAPALYNGDGTINWGLYETTPGSQSFTFTNPLAAFENPYRKKTNNLTSSALLSYQIFTGLNIKSNFGYNNLQSDETVLNKLSGIPTPFLAFFKGKSQYANNNINSWQIEPQLTYTGRINKGKFDALLGANLQQTNSSGLQLTGSGYATDTSLGDLKSAPQIQVNSTVQTIYKYAALFGKINYNYQDKYILDLSGRRDGTSRFGPANRFSNFWSVAGGWLFSNEGFIQNNASFLSFGKIKASFGTSGNDQIRDYMYLSLYTNTINQGNPYQGLIGLSPNGLSNPYLQWEETRKFNIGLDLGFFKDRILLSGNYFHNRSSNELTYNVLPAIVGFSGIFNNFPATVENSGWEFSANTSNIKNSAFQWTSNFNITFPKNKLTAFPGLSTSPYAQTYTIGKPVSIIKVFHFLGVNSTTGLSEYADKNGNATTSPEYGTDQTTEININPQFFGGFENSFTYKNMTLSFIFQFVKQTGGIYFEGNNSVAPGSYSPLNQPISVLSHWQKAGDKVIYQKYSVENPDILSSQEFITASDALYGDASYVRLKNLSLSWNLPQAWLLKPHVRNMKLYAQGQNLLTFTHYKGLDPESQSSLSLPPLRMLTFGIQIGL